MESLKHVRQQGRDAKKANDDNTGADGKIVDATKQTFSEHDCPYGPGDARDAWLAGFGGQEEAIEQANTSEPTTDDVRPAGNTETVREGAKPKGRGRKAQEAAADKTKVVTDVTGNGETSLVTKVVPENPEASDRVPTPETVIGDPAASQGPNDGNVQHADDETGRTDGAPKGTKATGQEVKPESLM